jgi:hypothetical protein
MNTKEWKEKAFKLHGDLYDYFNSVYTKALNKISIRCKIHGDFQQNARDHLRGHGCPICRYIKSSEKRKLTKNEFLERAENRNGTKYDYSKVTFKYTRDKIRLKCEKHGWFFIAVDHFLNGKGCQQCSIQESKIKRSLSLKEFKNKAREKHNNKYDYSFVEYKNFQTKIKIKCKKHGFFEQTPNNHIAGNGCPLCANEEKSRTCTLKGVPLSLQEFIERAEKKHKDKNYNYSEVEYRGYNVSICIKCPIHGPFYQTPNTHLQGAGCQICGSEDFSM